MFQLKYVRIIIVGLFILNGCQQESSNKLSFDKIEIWNMPADGMRVPAPRTLNIDNDGNLLVLDNAGRLIVFDPTGKVVKKWSMPDVELGHPEGVCVLNDGKIAVADTHYNRVVIFNSDGSVYKIWGEKGTAKGQFSNPVGICKDAKGDLYVCEYGDSDRVQKFSVDGKFLLSFGKGGTEKGEFQRPSGLFWHQGKVYVADAVNDRIQVFNDNGTISSMIAQNNAEKKLFYLPYDLCLGNDETLYVVEYGNSCISKLTLDGKLIGKFGSAGAARGQLQTPWGVAMDSAGRVFIADTGNRRIVVLR